MLGGTKDGQRFEVRLLTGLRIQTIYRVPLREFHLLVDLLRY